MSFLLMALGLTLHCAANPLPQGRPAPPAPPGAGPNARNCPTLPASALPGTTLALQYVAVGRGIQNYTCTGAGSTATALGAIATLYDATSLARSDINTLHTIPGLAVNTQRSAGGTYTLPAQFSNLPQLGNHLFLADGTPTFLLTAANKSLFAKKDNSTAAPADAPVGPAGTGAVDWLQLSAKDGMGSVGLSEVYRVETAGGKPTTCTDAGVITTEYAAEYWFYD